MTDDDFHGQQPPQAMNGTPGDRSTEFADPVGQAIASFTSSAHHLMQLALVPENRDRIANENDFEIIRQATLQAQLVGSLIECRMIANAAIAAE